MSNKRKRITDFVNGANEKTLNRLISVIEAIESPVIAYTHTGHAILEEEMLNFANAQKAALPREKLNHRMPVLNQENAKAEYQLNNEAN